MKLFYKNSKGKKVPITLRDALNHALIERGLKTDCDSFSDGSGSWVSISQETKKPSKILVNISFEDNGEEITSVSVYETPIEKVLMESGCIKLI